MKVFGDSTDRNSLRRSPAQLLRSSSTVDVDRQGQAAGLCQKQASKLTGDSGNLCFLAAASETEGRVLDRDAMGLL